MMGDNRGAKSGGFPIFSHLDGMLLDQLTIQIKIREKRKKTE